MRSTVAHMKEHQWTAMLCNVTAAVIMLF